MLPLTSTILLSISVFLKQVPALIQNINRAFQNQQHFLLLQLAAMPFLNEQDKNRNKSGDLAYYVLPEHRNKFSNGKLCLGA